MSEYASSTIARSGSLSRSDDQENDWIDASQRGDAVAFNRLVLKWEGTIYNVAVRMLQNREEASEATQEVFLQAFKNIRRFRRDSKFSTWIYRIVLNHCLTRLKQRPPGIQCSLEDAIEAHIPAPQLKTSETQLGEIVRMEERNRVLAALSHLPPDQRSVIELKFFQDLTFESISATLEVPISTVKSRLYAGLEMLKIRLGTL